MVHKMALVKGLRPTHPGHDPELPPCPLCGAPAYKGYRFERPDRIEHDCDCAYERWEAYYAALERAWRVWKYPRDYRDSLPEVYRELLDRPFDLKGEREAAERLERWTREGGLLYLFGPPGAGKTHLAVRAGWKRAQEGHRVLFRTEAEFLEEARKAALDEETPPFFGGASLVIDDVGLVRPTPFAVATLLSLVEEARQRRRSLLMAGVLPPAELAKRFGEHADTFLARVSPHSVLIPVR